MLESRNITATLVGETLRASMVRGCRKGGVLLLLLWSVVVDNILGLNNDGYYTVGYADEQQYYKQIYGLAMGALTSAILAETYI
jgi:hypothetical protein